MRAQPGQPIRIRAEDWNRHDRVADLVEEQMRAGGFAGKGRAPAPAGLVLVKNTSGSAVGRFEILGIDGVVVEQTDNADEFYKRVALTAGSPSTSSHPGKFVITWEPIANNGIGRAYVTGVCQVQINVTDASHGYADVTNGDSTKLTSAVAGGAQILWKESGTGTKWAVVRFVHSGLAHAEICS